MIPMFLTWAAWYMLLTSIHLEKLSQKQSREELNSISDTQVVILNSKLDKSLELWKKLGLEL